jgi:signal transduction histidine kinase
MTSPTPSDSTTWTARFAPLSRAFHAYAGWLVSIGWTLFALLAVLLMIFVSALQEVPPFSWSWTTVGEHVEETRTPLATSATSARKHHGGHVEVRIDDHGVHVDKAPVDAPDASAPATVPAAPSVDAGQRAASDAPGTLRIDIGDDDGDKPSVHIALPPGSAQEQVRDAIEETIDALDERAPVVETRERRVGSFLSDLAHLVIVASIIVKITYRKQIAAEAQAAQATETAEAEQLKRQVAEARIAAMQAQIEPHFLFNTLASIDHLIETDPPRASRMQKSLIALLRATMPAMRDAAATGAARTLGQEVDVVVPYLDILKMRMDDRLTTQIDVPAGLRSAECPAMVLQVLVENAIRHGLEPKPEGGALAVSAEIADGRLVVRVTDTGVGLAQARATHGTGLGLANVRERLQLLYGADATLTLEPLAAGGAVATLTMPYRTARAS